MYQTGWGTGEAGANPRVPMLLARVSNSEDWAPHLPHPSPALGLGTEKRRPATHSAAQSR